MMIDIVDEYLKGKKFVDFNDIFSYVSEKMNSEWKNKFANRNIKDVHIDKAGELYTILSIDGRFIKDKSTNNWSLIENFTYEEIQKMKINVSELFEQDEIEE